MSSFRKRLTGNVANTPQNTETESKLSSQEIGFLLRFIAGSTFHGENLKVLYKIVQKLEKQLHG